MVLAKSLGIDYGYMYTILYLPLWCPNLSTDCSLASPDRQAENAMTQQQRELSANIDGGGHEKS